MPKRHSRVIESDTEDDFNISSNSESEYSDTDNSESDYTDTENSESEYTDTEDNIEKVIDNNISDKEFNKEDNDINLLSNELSNVYINDNSLNKLIIDDYEPINKSVDYCYNQLEQFKIKHYAGSYKNKDGLKCIMDKDFIRINKYDNKEKNDGLFTFNNNTYLMILRVGKKQELRGKLFIEKDDYLTFLKLINNIVNNPNVFNYDYNKYYLNYLERLPPVCPLLIDCDIKYSNKKDYRIYNIIKNDIINECNNILKEYYNLDNPLYYLFEKNNASIKNIIKDGENKIIFKDGFHLGYMIPINHNEYEGFYNELRQRILLKDSFKKLLNENKDIEDTDINEIIDNCMTNNQAYMMIGNTKYEKDNYEPSPYYKLTLTNDENYEKKKKYSVILFSNYQFYLTNTEPLKLIKPFNINQLNNLSSDSDDKPKSKKQKLDDDIDIDTINNSSDTSDNEDVEKKINKENKYLTLDKVKTINSRFIIDDIRNFIDILDIKYSENEDDWYQIYYAIYSFKEVHPELLDEIKNEMDYFSLKSRKKYAKSDNESILKHYKKGKISLNNLIKYAYKSNKDKTNKLYGEIKRRNKILQEKEELEDFKKYDTTIKREEKEIINIPKDETFNYDYFYYLFKKDILECLNYWYKFNYFTSIKNTKGENIDIILRLKRITKEKEIFNTEKNEYVKKKYNYYEFEKILDINKIIPKTHFKYLLDEEIGNIKKIKNIDYKDIEQIIQKDNKILVKDLILHTLPFNKYYSFNDINAPLLYQIKYYNQYDIHFRTERFINFNHIAIEFYFNDILSCDKPNISFNDYGVKEICDFIKNYVCCKNDDEIYEEVEDDIKKVIDDKYNYIMNFFKCIFNRKRNNTILCLSGTQGTGKSTVSYIISKILGYNISHSEQGSGVFSQFNKYQSGLFFGIEEFEISDKSGNENNFAKLKNMITNPRVPIEKKGLEKEDVKNVCNYIITSNNINLFKLENSDRRTTIFNMFKTPKEGKQYFINLYKIIKNKECLINFYNYVKYSKFGQFDNIDVFKVQDAIITEEKNNLTVNTADTYNKFLINFYNLLEYIDKFPDEFNITELYKDVYVDDNNKIIYKNNAKDNFNELIKNKNTIKYICLTIPRFYKCYKNYCSKVLQLNENQGFNIENFKSNINKDKLYGYPLDKENKKSKNKYVFITKDYLFSLLNKKKLGNEFIDFDDENYANEFNAFDFIKY